MQVRVPVQHPPVCGRHPGARRGAAPSVLVQRALYFERVKSRLSPTHLLILVPVQSGSSFLSK
jgi:hypothetical protein